MQELRAIAANLPNGKGKTICREVGVIPTLVTSPDLSPPPSEAQRQAERRQRRRRRAQARRAAMVLAVVMALAVGHTADLFRRGVLAEMLPGPGAAALLLLVALSLLALWALPPLWAGKVRGYARLRLLGALAVLAGLAPHQPYATGLPADLYRAFWRLGPHPLTNVTLWGLVLLGGFLVCVGTRAWARADANPPGVSGAGPRPALDRPRGNSRAAGGPDTLMALLIYGSGLLLFANPLLTARLGRAWSLVPIPPVPDRWPLAWGPLGFWPLLAGTLALWLVASALYHRQRWGMQAAAWLNAIGALTAAWVALVYSPLAGVARLAGHLLFMALQSYPALLDGLPLPRQRPDRKRDATLPAEPDNSPNAPQAADGGCQM